jgi:hypothetical protein
MIEKWWLDLLQNKILIYDIINETSSLGAFSETGYSGKSNR